MCAVGLVDVRVEGRYIVILRAVLAAVGHDQVLLVKHSDKQLASVVRARVAVVSDSPGDIGGVWVCGTSNNALLFGSRVGSKVSEHDCVLVGCSQFADDIIDTLRMCTTAGVGNICTDNGICAGDGRIGDCHT
jgi:hypothetical protein